MSYRPLARIQLARRLPRVGFRLMPERSVADWCRGQARFCLRRTTNIGATARIRWEFRQYCRVLTHVIAPRRVVRRASRVSAQERLAGINCRIFSAKNLGVVRRIRATTRESPEAPSRHRNNLTMVQCDKTNRRKTLDEFALEADGCASGASRASPWDVV